MPSILFVSGECIKPFLHFGMAKVYAKATLNYLGNAPSCRQERIQICVERALPIGVNNRTRGLQSDIDRSLFGRLKRPAHHFEKKLCVLELQLNACPQFFVHE
jgi:hypothetical protein